MNHSDEPQVLLYQEIGQLFYAIAAADKVVRKVEYEALKNLVKLEWSSMNDYVDEFGVNAIYQMEIVFDWFDYEQLDANDCFKSFAEYYKGHKKLFSESQKQLIWKTANAIAGSFAGTNKSELILLTKLRLLLQKEN
jgi:hypothetical protein